MAADSTDSDKFLFNLGAVYKLNDVQQIYANFKAIVILMYNVYYVMSQHIL
jgi:hypothetical protein